MIPAGTVIAARYEIVRLLGEGGMGAVYQARQISMDRMVALKVIHVHIAQKPEVAERFHREMKATSKIEHPNTIQVFDYGATEDGRLFLAMEYLEGRPLSKIAADGPMPISRMLHIAKQVVRALDAAHQEGIAHRDLKPDNVMLVDRYGERDVVKVLDFGIARFVDGEVNPQMTAEGALLGTPAYMSPEQALGRAIDVRTDFYSLGIMLYELATGRLPFVAPTLAGFLMAHANELPPEPSAVAPGRVPKSLEDLILRLLSKSPDARPTTASELMRLLETCDSELTETTDLPPQQQLTTTPEHTPKRSSLVGPIVAVAFVLAGGAAAYVIAQGGGKKSEAIDATPGQPDAAAAACDDDVAKAVKLLDGEAGEAQVRTAKALADGAVERCPRTAAAHNVLGRAEQRAGHLREAEAAFRAALVLDERLTAARFNLGLVQAARDDAAGALATWNIVAAQQPDYPNLALMRGGAMLQLKQVPEAVAELERETMTRPSQGAAWLLLGKARERNKDARGARDAYCRAKALGEVRAAEGCP